MSPSQDPEQSSSESLPLDEEKAVPPEPEQRDQAVAVEKDATPTPPPAAGPSPPPNGGLQAWMQVLGGFMLFFNTWGILK
jgi:hypothetical protein